MDHDVLTFAGVAAVIVALVGSLTLIGVSAAWAVRRMRRPDRARLDASDPDERLEHLQQSVDAIAIEVERIAEGQRYTVKLLAERADAPR